ncbi:uncharacterized protein LOC100573684 isoform X3 [Acyrthosiphon pisum]|uniref:Uncharacterized protein n=1 Tax=Acyrthosiphon pisum TaxID=7029 RepID=A0A8R2JVK9_ACYPI|nr:uncharacterized protein LOC100573684 isoform X3 [Acyrthosiphon pisum]
MKSAKRILLSSVTIFQCLKLTFALQLNIPKPDTVYLSVPANQYNNIQWLENPNYMKSTCGTFAAYETKRLSGDGIPFTCQIFHQPRIIVVNLQMSEARADVVELILQLL